MSDTTHALSPRQVPPARVAQARAFAFRCATFDKLRNRPAWPEKSPAAPGGLFDRVQRRVPKTALLVYGVVRQAVRCGWDGVWCSYVEMAELVGACDRQVQRSVNLLVELELLRKVPEFDTAREGSPAALAGYSLQRLRNAYALGVQAAPVRPAKKAGRVVPGGGGGPPGRPDKMSDKMSKLCPSGAGSPSYEGPSCPQDRSTLDGEERVSVDQRTGYVKRRTILKLVPGDPGSQTRTQRKEPELSAATAAFEARTRKASEQARATSGPLRAALAERMSAAGVDPELAALGARLVDMLPNSPPDGDTTG